MPFFFLFFFFFAFVAASSGALSSAAGAATAAGSEPSSSGGFSGRSRPVPPARQPRVSRKRSDSGRGGFRPFIPSSSAFAPSPDSPAFPASSGGVFVVTTVVVTFFASRFRVWGSLCRFGRFRLGRPASTGVSAADGASASGASAASAVSDVSLAPSQRPVPRAAAFRPRGTRPPRATRPRTRKAGTGPPSPRPSPCRSAVRFRRKSSFFLRGRRGGRRRQLDRLAQELELGSSRLGRRAPPGELLRIAACLLLQRAWRAPSRTRRRRRSPCARSPRRRPAPSRASPARRAARLRCGRAPLRRLGELLIRLAQACHLLQALLARLAQRRLALLRETRLLGVPLSRRRAVSAARSASKDARRAFRRRAPPPARAVSRRARPSAAFVPARSPPSASPTPPRTWRARRRARPSAAPSPPPAPRAAARAQVAFEQRRAFLLVALRSNRRFSASRAVSAAALFAQTRRPPTDAPSRVALAQRRLLCARRRAPLVALAREFSCSAAISAARPNRLILQAVRLAAAPAVSRAASFSRSAARRWSSSAFAPRSLPPARRLRLVRGDGQTQALHLLLRRLRLRKRGAGSASPPPPSRASRA